MTTSADTGALTVTASWSEVPALIGRAFRSDYFQVDRDHQQLFEAAAYLDRNEHEMDADFYDDDLVEGIHLLGIVDHLTNAVLYVSDPRWAGWNYGYDRVRFVSEVSTRDSIRVSGTVTDIANRGDAFLVTLDCVVEVAGRDRPGAVIEWKVLWTCS